jgi:hypothetical protein
MLEHTTRDVRVMCVLCPGNEYEDDYEEADLDVLLTASIEQTFFVYFKTRLATHISRECVFNAVQILRKL